MINLLEDVKKVLEEHGKTIDEIVWFGTSECKFDFDIDQLKIVCISDTANKSWLNEFKIFGEDFYIVHNEVMCDSNMRSFSNWNFKYTSPKKSITVDDDINLDANDLKGLIYSSGIVDGVWHELREEK